MTNQTSDVPGEGASKTAATVLLPGASAATTPEAPVSRKPGDPEVEVTFVFVDAVKHGIKGLDVKMEGGGKSQVAVTGEDGAAASWLDAKRGEPIKIYVKKRTGEFDLKGSVTPKLDVNNYTIQSPEYHLEAITKLDAEEQLELDLNIPRVKEGEVMTVERLTGELAPYIASKQVVTEAGKVLKDSPVRKRVVTVDPKTKKAKTKIEIEHHYKAVETGKPHTVAMYVLGSRLNYPKSFEISDAMYRWIKVELDKELVAMRVIKANDPGVEIAAVKAIVSVESSGNGFTVNGLPKILFERHIFYGLTAPPEPAKGQKPKPHPYAKFPDICNPQRGGYDSGFVKENFREIEFGKKLSAGDKYELFQYERFVKAALLDRDAAICACSWGAFQVVAKPYAEFGYSSPSDIANECMESIEGQCRLFVSFLKMKDKRSAIAALYKKDWEGFTAKYNGQSWKSANPDYPSKMKERYEEFK